MDGGRLPRAAEDGFGRGAAEYEQGRPGYPAEVVDLLASELGMGPGSTVIDLGAGTGKLTRLLLPTGARVVAVEPVAAMREQLAALVPGAAAVDGTAESIPLPDSCADVVTVAQAFHWFDGPKALTEIRRVLAPGGGLALIWNVRDGSVPWVARLSEIIHWHRHDVSAYEDRIDWAAVVAGSGGFTPLLKAQVRHEQLHDLDTLLARVSSVSYISAMPEHEREGVLQQVRELAAGFPARFPMPYRTDIYWCRRLG